MSLKSSITTLSEQAFWDVDMKSLDWHLHKSFILERIMQYGTHEDYMKLLILFGKDDVKEAALQANDLDDFSISYLSLTLGTPPSSFKCYKRKQSQGNFWNY